MVLACGSMTGSSPTPEVLGVVIALLLLALGYCIISPLKVVSLHFGHNYVNISFINLSPT